MEQNYNPETSDEDVCISEFKVLRIVFEKERTIFIDAWLINTRLSIQPEFKELNYNQLLCLALNGLLNYDQENIPFKWYKFREMKGTTVSVETKVFFANTYYLGIFIPDVCDYRNQNRLSNVRLLKISIPQYNNLENTQPIGGTERTSRYPTVYSKEDQEAINKLFYS